MGRDNQKEKTITPEQARELVRDALEKVVLKTGANVWVGDVLEADHSGYVVPANPYHTGEIPHENYKKVWVDGWTGEVSFALDLIG